MIWWFIIKKKTLLANNKISTGDYCMVVSLPHFSTAWLSYWFIFLIRRGCEGKKVSPKLPHPTIQTKPLRNPCGSTMALGSHRIGRLRATSAVGCPIHDQTTGTDNRRSDQMTSQRKPAKSQYPNSPGS